MSTNCYDVRNNQIQTNITATTPSKSADKATPAILAPAEFSPEPKYSENETNIIQERKQEIAKLLKQFKIKPQIIVNILSEVCNLKDNDLLKLDDIKFKKLLFCIELALKDSTKDEKIDNDKFVGHFLGYKINILDKNKTVEEARIEIEKFENKDLIDLIIEKNPSLKGKTIEQISAKELKEALCNIIRAGLTEENIKKFQDKPDIAKNMMFGYFTRLLSKCDDKEKSKLFMAFALLLKDKDIQAAIPEAYKKTLLAFKNTEKLAEMINKIGPELLKELGFDDETIKIINFEAMKELTPEQLGDLINDIVEVINQIDENDIPIVKKVLTSINNNQIENLTEEELNVYRKYQNIIDNAVSAIAIKANRPELYTHLKEHFNQLLTALEKKGLKTEFYGQVELFYNQHQDLFDGISKDDFTKAINEITNNEYSAAIGDTNPDNLCKTDGTSTGDNSRICYQNDPSVDYAAIMANNARTIQNLYNQQQEDFEYVVLKDGNKKDDTLVTPWQKYNSIEKLSASEIFDGIAKKYIKIGDVIDKYNDLSQSGKDFVNKLVEIMSPGQQNYFLNGIKNTIVLTIIRHTNIDPSKLELALDYASQKEVDRIMEEKEKQRS